MMRMIQRNMYSIKTIEYLMLKQKKMTLTEHTIIFEVSVRFFTNEKCNEMMRWISQAIFWQTFHKVV